MPPMSTLRSRITRLCSTASLLACAAALLLPAVAAVRESALVVKCASNLRQIGQAVHAYKAGHRTFPFAAAMPPPFRAPLDPGPPINDVLAPHLPPDSGVYRCPGDEVQVYDRVAAASPKGHGVSYLYWPPFYGPGAPGAMVAGTALRVKDVMFWEYGGSDLHGLIDPQFHKGGNVLLWDGSVTFLRGDN